MVLLTLPNNIYHHNPLVHNDDNVDNDDNADNDDNDNAIDTPKHINKNYGNFTSNPDCLIWKNTVVVLNTFTPAKKYSKEILKRNTQKNILWESESARSCFVLWLIHVKVEAKSKS